MTRTEDGGPFSEGEIGVSSYGSAPSGGCEYAFGVASYGSRVKTRQSLTPHPSPLTPHSSPALFLFTIHHSHFALLASCSSLPSVCRLWLPFLLPLFVAASRCRLAGLNHSEVEYHLIHTGLRTRLGGDKPRPYVMTRYAMQGRALCLPGGRDLNANRYQIPPAKPEAWKTMGCLKRGGGTATPRGA